MSLDENLARLDELFSSLYGEFFLYEKKGDYTNETEKMEFGI